MEQLLEQNLTTVLNEASQKLKTVQESLDDQIQTNNSMEIRLEENESKTSQLLEESKQLKSENANLKEIVEVLFIAFVWGFTGQLKISLQKNETFVFYSH
jgi:predicted nuclease with TOPRIM domain